MLHIALFGVAALLNINQPIAEDIGKYADSNRRVLISSVFRNSPAASEKADSADSKSIDNLGAGEVTADSDADSVNASEKSLEAAENITVSDNADEVVYEERTAESRKEGEQSDEQTESSEETEKSAKNTESINSSNAVPETLSISSFTTDLSPVYPKYAKKNNYEGLVRVSLTVNRNGRGENIKVVKSSGYSVLDKAAVKAVKKAVFRAKSSRVYYLSAALKKPLLVDINFSLT